jgi:hypothetical protein
MDQGNDTALAASRQGTAHTLRPSRLHELPGAPLGPVSEPVSSELTARLGRAAQRTAHRVSGWRLVAWLEDQPLAALRQATAATAVGAALVMHHRIELAWQLPILALLGLGFLLVGGRVSLATLGRSMFAVGDSASDPEADAANPTRTQLRVITALLAMAAACFLPLALAGGRPLVMAGISAAVIAAVLLNRFVPRVVQSPAESVARLGLTIVAVSLVVLAQTGAFTADICVAGLQVGLFACVQGAMDNMRNLARDRKNGRRTVVSSLGVPAGRFQIALMCLLPYSMCVCWTFAGAWGAAFLPLLTLPLAFWIIRDVNMYLPGPVFEQFRPRAAALHLAFSILLTAGLLI